MLQELSHSYYIGVFGNNLFLAMFINFLKLRIANPVKNISHYNGWEQFPRFTLMDKYCCC